MWVNTNISGMLWPSNATFQAVSHLSKISTWVAAEKHNAPYPRVNPSFVEVNDKTVFDFSGVRTGKVWLPFELRVGDILQENESDFHSGGESLNGFADLSPLCLKRAYPLGTEMFL